MTDIKGTKLVFADRGKEAEFAKISYTNDVVPILMDKCVDCHQPNGIAPWHMTNYQQVKTFCADDPRSDPSRPHASLRRRQPLSCRSQKNENLSAEETKTLIHWIEAGAPSDIAEGGEDPLVKGVARASRMAAGRARPGRRHPGL